MKPIYSAVFLDDESRDRLRFQFPDRNKQVWHAHHMTIKFKPTADEVAALSLGEHTALTARSWVTDWLSCIAVEVENSLSSNNHPHITVQCLKGTSPSFSNVMLKQHADVNLHFRYLFEEPLILHGRVGVFDAKTQQPYFGE